MSDLPADDRTQDLAWKRFWYPRGVTPSLVDGGFLVDPTSFTGRLVNPQARTFEGISEYYCLALLGEPGIGKSRALKDGTAALRSRANASGEIVHELNLNAYGSEDRFVRDAFGDASFQRWLTDGHVLHLVLDSLDECLLKINTMADLLLQQLQLLRPDQTKRLRIIIACRTAEWPAHLENGLRGIWGNANLGVYELAPLTEADVRLATSAYEIDARGFLTEVGRVSAVPFAIKPVTLHFLLKTFRRDQHLPATRDALYLEGCRQLCEEASGSRRAAGNVGTLDAEQKLAIAERIAAITIFCNRSIIYQGVGEALDSDAELRLRELSGGAERVNEGEVRVNEDALREVLATGLFAGGRGSERIGWAHQTYAEFLAARYVVTHQLSMPQIRSLIFDNVGQHRVVPQLHETAAWLADASPPILAAIIESDPQLLLRGDLSSATDETRSQIVASMLRMLAADQLIDTDIDLYAKYKMLGHVGLRQQLEPFIRDRSYNLMVRRFAIELAGVCSVLPLQGLLADVALDETDLCDIRVEAARAVVTIGDAVTRTRLRPLAEGHAGDDPDDDLKGWGLRAIWPQSIGAVQVFELLTPQKRPILHGAYAGFLHREMLSHLDRNDLPVALEWVAKRPVHYNLFDNLRKLADEIIVKAWDNLDVAGVLEPLADLVVMRFVAHVAMVRRTRSSGQEPLWSLDDPRRLQLMEALVPRLTMSGLNANRVIYGPTRLLTAADLEWMIDRLRICGVADQREIWAQLICILASGHALDPHDLDLLIPAVAELPELRNLMGEAFEPWELNSKRAERARAAHLEMTNWRPPEAPVLKPPPHEHVEFWLSKCEGAEPDKWWMLNLVMTLEERSTSYGNMHEPDITKFPGWTSADSRTRERIIRSAQVYLSAGDPYTDDWLGKDVSDERPAAGYRALLLLSHEAPAALASLPEDIWHKWASAIIAYPTHSDMTDEEQGLVCAAYAHAPKAVIKYVSALINIENEKHGHLFVLQRIGLCWDEAMKSALCTKLAEPLLKAGAVEDLLDELLKRGSEQTQRYAESLIPTPPPSEELQMERSLRAAKALIEHTSDAGWSVIWPAIQSDFSWGETLVASLAHRYDIAAGVLTRKLSESEAAEFFEWLTVRFPPAEDPPLPIGAYAPSPRETVGRFRDAIIGDLRMRGTAAACRELERLARQQPDRQYLKWNLVLARQEMLRKTWAPPRPEYLLQLARDRRSRLVDSGEQLLDVLLESLSRWEHKLQGETPAAFRLWDQVETRAHRSKNDDKHRPKPEDKLADDIVIHLTDDLRQRGVVANREVVIRKGEGPGGVGERTDIHVNAIRQTNIPNEYDVITVIIEVKGCWNPDVYSAMKTQLVDRYLKDNECQHGVYVVGWFMCPQWDSTDPRRSAVPDQDLQTAKSCFREQAHLLSRNSVTVRAFVANTALR